MNKILRDCAGLCDEINRTIGGEAADLRDRLKAERDAYSATIPKRVRSWNSPEGERVAAMKVRLMNTNSLIQRLDDLAAMHEILTEDISRLERK